MALKEEGEIIKRKRLMLEQGSAKKMKTSEEVSEEDLKEMMQLVPVEEVYVCADDEFINIFSTPMQDKGETSSRHADSSNIHTFCQRYPSEQRWTKDHPLEQVIGNPSQSVKVGLR
nr:hypothetical protein [Tanacetum cinerariifolium]